MVARRLSTARSLFLPGSAPLQPLRRQDPAPHPDDHHLPDRRRHHGGLLVGFPVRHAAGRGRLLRLAGNRRGADGEPVLVVRRERLRPAAGEAPVRFSGGGRIAGWHRRRPGGPHRRQPGGDPLCPVGRGRADGCGRSQHAAGASHEPDRRGAGGRRHGGGEAGQDGRSARRAGDDQGLAPPDPDCRDHDPDGHGGPGSGPAVQLGCRAVDPGRGPTDRLLRQLLHRDGHRRLSVPVDLHGSHPPNARRRLRHAHSADRDGDRIDRAVRLVRDASRATPRHGGDVEDRRERTALLARSGDAGAPLPAGAGGGPGQGQGFHRRLRAARRQRAGGDPPLAGDLRTDPHHRHRLDQPRTDRDLVDRHRRDGTRVRPVVPSGVEAALGRRHGADQRQRRHHARAVGRIARLERSTSGAPQPQPAGVEQAGQSSAAAAALSRRSRGASPDAGDPPRHRS